MFVKDIPRENDEILRAELAATTLIVGSAFLTQVLSRKFSKAVHDAHVLIRDADRQQIT